MKPETRHRDSRGGRFTRIARIHKPTKLPRLDPETRWFYEPVLPSDERIETRSMLGGLGSFVNGNRFAGSLGDRVFLRLPDLELGTLLWEPGGGPFEPVAGRVMKGYATLAGIWKTEPDRAKEWVKRSLAWVAAMPAKRAAKKKAR